jgi:predicted phosphodiesterase
VVLGGDMCAGAIHTSNRVLSTELTVDQIMHVSELIAEMIADLSAYVTSVRVYSTFGNHSRVVANLSESVHEDNFERLIPFWLRERFREIPHISIEDGSCHELLGFDVNGHAVCAVHGDLDGGKDSALPLALLYRRNFGKAPELLITGHFHHHMNIDQAGIECVQSGSLCGTDEYAKNKRLFARPSQTLLIFNNRGIDSVHNILLDDIQAVS